MKTILIIGVFVVFILIAIAIRKLFVFKQNRKKITMLASLFWMLGATLISFVISYTFESMRILESQKVYFWIHIALSFLYLILYFKVQYKISKEKPQIKKEV